MTEPAFRCAAASELRDDGLAGSASTVRAYLLVEDPGPWGVDALRDARIPDGEGRQLQQSCAAAKVRPLLIRRHGAARDGGAGAGRRVFAAYADPVQPWLETTTVESVGELCDADLAGLRAGRSLGWTRSEESLFCVCTHGKHDACCAERGRPAVAALAQAHPEQTWEVSHIGGDRFSGNLLVLPHGLYHGRIEPRSALEVAGAHLAGELTLDHLRGRSGLPMPVQAAEVALRRTLGVTRADDVRFVDRRSADGVTRARFEVAGARWTVQVTTRHEGMGRLTCGATRDNPVPRHRVDEVTRDDEAPVR